MDMERIKPSTMSILCAILYSQAHFDANYCNINTTVIGSIPKAQKNPIGMKYIYLEITQQYMVEVT